MILNRLINYIESNLSKYYGYSLVAPAENHLVSRDQLLVTLGESVLFSDEWDARASVWILEPRSFEEDLFIGITIDDEMRDILENNNPIDFLGETNIDAFCALIEEISHFHLIVNRVITRRSVSKLELEWQSEIDKLVICADILREQSGDAHLLPLTRRFFDLATIIDQTTSSRYHDASRYAAKLCYKICRIGNLNNEKIRRVLRTAYFSNWHQKIEILNDFEIERVA